MVSVEHWNCDQGWCDKTVDPLVLPLWPLGSTAKGLLSTSLSDRIGFIYHNFMSFATKLIWIEEIHSNQQVQVIKLVILIKRADIDLAEDVLRCLGT